MRIPVDGGAMAEGSKGASDELGKLDPTLKRKDHMHGEL